MNGSILTCQRSSSTKPAHFRERGCHNKWEVDKNNRAVEGGGGKEPLCQERRGVFCSTGGKTNFRDWFFGERVSGFCCSGVDTCEIRGAVSKLVMGGKEW